ncbi:MAG: hypothetical protein ACLURV_10485 [Gallintestinimicrobium sp.]
MKTATPKLKRSWASSAPDFPTGGVILGTRGAEEHTGQDAAKSVSAP